MTYSDETNDTEPFDLDDPIVHDPRLAEFIGALRAPGTAHELAAEFETIALLTAALRAPVAAKERSMKQRFTRGAAIAAAAVLSVGGVAAAATGSNPFDSFAGDRPSFDITDGTTTTTEATTTTSTTTTEAATTTTAAPMPTTTEASAPASDPACTAAANHGEYVSGVAKKSDSTTSTTVVSSATTEGDKGAATHPENHGKAVSEAAESDCGKPVHDDATESATTSDDDDTTDDHDATEIEDEDDDSAEDGARTTTTTVQSKSTESGKGKSENSGRGKG